MIKDATDVKSLDFERIEIVIDDDHEDFVEIYMLDESGRRIEGGEFDRSEFAAAKKPQPPPRWQH